MLFLSDNFFMLCDKVPLAGIQTTSYKVIRVSVYFSLNNYFEHMGVLFWPPQCIIMSWWCMEVLSNDTSQIHVLLSNLMQTIY